jgi:hypothetical protein
VENDFLGFRDVREDLEIDCSRELLFACEELNKELQKRM